MTSALAVTVAEFLVC